MCEAGAALSAAVVGDRAAARRSAAMFGDPMSALAQLQLARTLVSSGDRDKAKAAYETFLALWKDADAGLSTLEHARAEYAKLH